MRDLKTSAAEVGRVVAAISTLLSAQDVRTPKHDSRTVDSTNMGGT